MTNNKKTSAKSLKYWIGLLKPSEKYVVILPSIWFLLFLLFPFLFLVKISLSDYVFNVPPFSPLFEWVDGQYLRVELFFSNYLSFFKDNLYFKVYLESILTALISTCLAVIISYPFAYAIYKSSPKVKTLLILLIVLPFYTSFLLRVYAWVGLLGKHGTINNVLLWLGIINEPLKLLYTKFAVVIGITYCYLPFMIIPIYVSLDKMNTEYLEAAYDLGSTPIKTFFTVTLPLTKNGLFAGCILMFIPAIGEFIIPEILGGANTLMIGRIVWNEFFNNRDWPFSAAIAILMFVFVIIPLNYLQKAEKPAEANDE
ncbi:MAG: ABC transporter permease subunit [Candidatus Paracaedibacteraceae bacterium]|nr:ABC transporter permease subunit [Candidatus Paracaedibacteraceae bacterium]